MRSTTVRKVSKAWPERAEPLIVVAPRQRRTQEQRRKEAELRILDAAVEIIAARGLDALTLADAGTEAGFSKGLPIHYFGTKNELVAAVAKYILRVYVMKAAERTKDLKDLERLKAAIGFYFDYPLQNSTVVRAYHIVLNGALNKPELKPLVEKIHGKAVQEIYQTFRRSLGIGGGASRLAELRAQSVLLYSALFGAVAQWLVDPNAIDLPAVRDAVISGVNAMLEKKKKTS
jgi:AcrR family transcriptional regulator